MLPRTSFSTSGDADKDAQAMAVAQQITDQCKEGVNLERIQRAASGIYLLHVLGGRYTNKEKITEQHMEFSVKMSTSVLESLGEWCWNAWNMRGFMPIRINILTSGVS